MSNSSNNCLVARQPILDRSSSIVAYELLFRPVGAGPSAQTNGSFATANVALNTLLSFGLDNVLGNQRGFLNVELEFLMSDAIEILPCNRIVLELLETVEVTPAVVERCRHLHDKGYKFAIDDHEFDPAFEELYQIADIIKLDLMQTPLDKIPDMIRALRKYPVKILAEKVETRQEFETCLEMGFDLFQGYYFARPMVLEKKRIDETLTTMLKLVQLLGQDAELKEIEEVFRRSPGLSYKLLQLINSVLMPTLLHIKSIRHALVLLGRHQLKRWTQLALFATDDGQIQSNPLVEMAAVRASFMENLASRHPSLKTDKNSADLAFMAGILSVLDNIFDVNLAEVVTNLRLPKTVTQALIAHEGPLGGLLTIAETLDQSYGTIDLAKMEACGVSQSEVHLAMFEAYQWLSAPASRTEPD